MKKRIALLLAILLIIGSLPAVALADDMPYSDQYGEYRIKINGKESRDFAYACRGNIYISFGALKGYGDASSFSLDTKNLRLEFDASQLKLNFLDPEVSAFIKSNAGVCYLPVKHFDPHGGSSKDYYISLASIAQMLKLKFKLGGKVVEIESYAKADNMGSLLRDEAAASIKNAEAALSAGQSVFVVGESKSFYKVQDLSGALYYVNKDALRRFASPDEIYDFEYVPTPKEDYSARPINIAWLNLSDTVARTALPPINNGGLDVICYPWAHQTVDGGGSSYHSCDYGIVQLAHQLGYKAWLTVNNSFMSKGSTNYTAELLDDPVQSDKLIAQYLLYACIYNMDGINVDYEDMPRGYGKQLGSFCAKLAAYCDKLGLISSIATYAYTPYNTGQFDFESFAQNMDYVAPMLYSENGKGTVGSIESKGWYTRILSDMMQVVPAEKILMGVPFFSRYYYLDSNGNNVSSKSGTITMGNARNKILSNKAEPYWAEQDGQFVVKYPSDEPGYSVMMWLEDEYSMALRMEYVLENKLAGTACWALYDNDAYIKEILPMFGAIYGGADPKAYYKDKY